MALGLATVAETVTVSGAAPVVDVAATSGSTLLTKEMLELTPTSRNGMMSLLTLAPGVRSFLDVGGNQMVESSNARVFGQGGEVWSTLEGIATAGLSGGDGGRPVGLANDRRGARPDPRHRCGVRPTRGVQLNAIVKSGGNDSTAAGLGPDEPPFSEQQHRRQVEGAGHHDRQHARERSTTSGGTWVAASSGTSCGSTGRAPEALPVSIRSLNAFKPDGSPASTMPTAEVAHRKSLVSGEPVEPVHRLLASGLSTAGKRPGGRARGLGVARGRRPSRHAMPKSSGRACAAAR